MEEQPPVDASVRAELFLSRPRTDATEDPPLELVRVLPRELARILHRVRLAEHLEINAAPETGKQPVLHESDREVGDIDADPSPVQSVGNRHGRPAAAEGVEHEVALV